jgi:hypothetical protein
LDPGPHCGFLADRFEYDGSAKGLHRPLVVELTPDRFQKEYLGRIGPRYRRSVSERVHTLNVLGERCLVDGKRTVFDSKWLPRGRIHGWKVRTHQARSHTPRPG